MQLGRAWHLAGLVHVMTVLCAPQQDRLAREAVKRLPIPLVMDDRYVVLTSEQWGRVCVDHTGIGRLPAPYVSVFAESYSRHVIVQETLGM